MYPEVAASLTRAASEFDLIPNERQATLRNLAEHVEGSLGTGKPTRLIFICTHNSRRSHMAQLWAQTAAVYYGVSGVETFSGGTEATAFDPRAVAAIQRAGFEVTPVSQGPNPIYHVRFSETVESKEAFSKVYDQPPNPISDFTAVMTCSEADAACPMVLGATKRIAITYEDPKAFDGTDRETDAYDERCRQIAREMLFVFSQVQS